MNTDKYEAIYEWVWYDDIGRDFTAWETFDWYVEMRKKGYKVFLDHHGHPPAHDLLAEVKRLREELRITQSNFSMVRNALANQYPEIEEAIWKVIE